MQTVKINSRNRDQHRTAISTLSNLGSVLPSAFKSLWLRLQLVLIASLILMSLGVRAVNADAADNPFTAYESILPGQPISALEPFDCSEVKERRNGELVEGAFFCSMLPVNERFDIVNVRGENGLITEVTFYATEMTLGDLLLYFGYPTNEVAGEKQKQYSWARPEYTVEVFAPHLRFYNRVRIVVFSSEVELAPVVKDQV